MFLGNIAQGVGQGLTNVAKGEMDREKANQLKEQGQRAKEQFAMQKEQHGQSMQQGKLTIEQLEMQNKSMQQQYSKMLMTQAMDTSFSYIDDYYKEGGEDPKLLNTALVQNKDMNMLLANNKTLGIDLGQITRVVDNPDDTFTLVNDLTGKEKTLPEHLVMNSLGYYTKRDAVQVERAEKAYIVKKRKQEEKLSNAKIGQAWASAAASKAQAKKYEKEADNVGKGGGGLSIKDQLYIQEKLLSIQSKTNEVNVNQSIGELDKLAAVPGNENQIYNTIVSNTALHSELFPDESTKKVVREGRTAAKLSQRMTDYADDLGKAIDDGQTSGLDKMVVNFFAKYNVGTEEAVKASAKVEGLVSRGESITADQLKLITGAAFNDTEMEVRLGALVSAMRGYEGGNVSKEKLKESLNEWKATASNYTLPLTNTHQAFIKGSLNQSDSQFDKKVNEKPKTFNIKGKEFPVGYKFKMKDGSEAELTADGKLVPVKAK